MKRPNTETLALLDAARHAHGDCSDYRIARLLGVTTNYLTAWRRGGHLSDESAIKLAELAGLDPVESVLRIAAEREGGASGNIYRQALARIASTSASILLAVMLGVGSLSGARSVALAGVAKLSSPAASDACYILSKIILAWLQARIRAALRLPLWCLA